MRPPVAYKGLLVSNNRQPCHPHFPITDVRRSSTVVASGDTVDVGWSTSGATPSLSLYTDTSLAGCGAHLLDLTASGLESNVVSLEHMTVLHIRAVKLALAAFLPQLTGQCVISDYA